MFKYEEIANDLQRKIKAGEYNPSQKLPKEYELCEQYGASRTTIREAMEALEYKGLIVKRRGSGSYVKNINEQEEVQKGFLKSSQFNGFSKDKSGKRVISKVLEFAVINPPEEVAAQLKIPSKSFVYYICRVRIIDDEPYVVEYTYMPINVISDVTEDVVASSIYAHIEDTLHLKIRSCHRIARALFATEDEKKWLNIKENEACIFEVEQVAYLDDGRIFEYSKSHHRSDKFELKTISLR